MPNPIRWAARTFIKPITIRLRWYLQADVMAELTALRAQLGTPTPAATHSLDNVIHSVESALLTLAVLGPEGQQGQGALPPGPPLRAQPLEPHPVREERGLNGTGVSAAEGGPSLL